MLAMVVSGLNAKLEERHRILADSIENVLKSLSKTGMVSDQVHSLIKNEIEDLGLLPQGEPLGTDFYIYIRELAKSLRTGNKETQDFVRDWRGRRS